MNKVIDAILDHEYVYDFDELCFVKRLTTYFSFYIVIEVIDEETIGVKQGRKISGEDIVYRDDVHSLIRFVGWGRYKVFIPFFEKYYNILDYELVNRDTYFEAVSNGWNIEEGCDRSNIEFERGMSGGKVDVFCKGGRYVVIKFSCEKNKFTIYFEDSRFSFGNLGGFNEKLQVLLILGG